ncbi:MAG TPA: aldo/keto reductase [archaeon]|nr:aldo/keto reductase [archaeon]
MKIPGIKLKDGNSIPSLGLGTWQLTGKKCFEAVSIALETGYRFIDTAEIYSNQKEIGSAIKGFPRKKIFLSSKVWALNLGFSKTLKACDKTLQELGTDYLDLYLIHWPNRLVPVEETFAAFAELKKQGKVKSFGVSNFSARRLEEAIPKAKAAGISIVNNQCEFHPHLFQKELLDYCKKNKIAFTAYSPLGRGSVLKDSVITKLAKEYSKTPAQICLRWELQKGAVVIPKSSSREHLEENIAVFSWKLSEGDIEKIDSIKTRKRLLNPVFFADFS